MPSFTVTVTLSTHRLTFNLNTISIETLKTLRTNSADDNVAQEENSVWLLRLRD